MVQAGASHRLSSFRLAEERCWEVDTGLETGKLPFSNMLCPIIRARVDGRQYSCPVSLICGCGCGVKDSEEAALNLSGP